MRDLTNEEREAIEDEIKRQLQNPVQNPVLMGLIGSVAQRLKKPLAEASAEDIRVAHDEIVLEQYLIGNKAALRS